MQWGRDLYQDKTLKPEEPAEGVAERCSWEMGHTENEALGLRWNSGSSRIKTQSSCIQSISEGLRRFYNGVIHILLKCK